MASIWAPRQIPRNGRCSRSGTAIQSISRRMKSSGSFTLIGPPKMTAPAWPSSVSGRGSPKRGRLISNLCPSARSTLPTRPGVDVSWCRTISTGSKEVALEGAAACGPRLKFRRHRTGTQDRDAHAAGSELPAQRLAERQHIGLGRVIYRHPRSRQKAGDRTDIKDAAAMPDQLIGESQRQIGGGANVDGDNAELFCAVQFDRVAEQAKAGIVDDELDLHPFGGQGGGNPVAGIGLLEIAGNHHRRRTAACLDFTRQRRKPFRPSRHQSDAMTVRCENARQFAPYSSRGPRNQRYALSHDPMLLNKLHNVQPSRGTTAYALGGTQATCKPIGAFNTT